MESYPLERGTCAADTAFRDDTARAALDAFRVDMEKCKKRARQTHIEWRSDGKGDGPLRIPENRIQQG